MHVVIGDVAVVLAAFVVALVASYADQPPGERFWLSKRRQLAEQIQTDGLKNIGGFLLGKTGSDRDGIDQILIFRDKVCPRALVAAAAALDKLRVGARGLDLDESGSCAEAHRLACL